MSTSLFVIPLSRLCAFGSFAQKVTGKVSISAVQSMQKFSLRVIVFFIGRQLSLKGVY